MKNFKWGTESFNSKPVHVVLFVSRNKDNKDVENFTERRESFITHLEANSPNLVRKFYEFAERGVPGETSRFYFSVNARDPKKIHKQLLHFLIDEPEFNLCNIQSKLAGIAAQKNCAAERKWMFDFDSQDEDLLFQFINDIHELDPDPELLVSAKLTPHGYAVITTRGFDCRLLMDKYPFVALKRDDLFCIDWRTKERDERTGKE